MKNKIFIFGLASLLLFTSCFAGIKTYAQNTSTLSSNSSCSLENLSNCDKDGLIILLIQLILQKINNTGTTLPTPSQTSELVLSNINCDDYNVTVEYCNTGNIKEDELFLITLKNEKTGQKVTSASFLNIPQSGTCNYWTVLYNAIGLSYGEEATLSAEIEWENKAITKKNTHKLEKVVNVPVSPASPRLSNLVLHSIDPDDYSIRVRYCNNGNYKEDELFLITLKNEQTGQKVTSASFLNIPQPRTCNYWTVHQGTIGLSYGEEAVLTAEVNWENKAITKKDTHKLEKVVSVP